jgi:hypothetical protein
MGMNESDKSASEMPNDELHWARVYLNQGLVLLGVEYPERVAILLILKKKEDILKLLWWIRNNIERKPSREELMDQFQIIAEPYSVTF